MDFHKTNSDPAHIFKTSHTNCLRRNYRPLCQRFTVHSLLTISSHVIQNLFPIRSCEPQCSPPRRGTGGSASESSPVHFCPHREPLNISVGTAPARSHYARRRNGHSGAPDGAIHSRVPTARHVGGVVDVVGVALRAGPVSRSALARCWARRWAGLRGPARSPAAWSTIASGYRLSFAWRLPILFPSFAKISHG
jgi:hypothetical protein